MSGEQVEGVLGESSMNLWELDLFLKRTGTSPSTYSSGGLPALMHYPQTLHYFPN